METFSIGRERHRNENNKTVRGRAGRDRHDDGQSAGRYGPGRRGSQRGGFPAFIGPLHHVTTLASTVPANGDVNPYGVAVIPRSTGNLWQGNTLISNFNDKTNAQGTGTTIVEITPHGHVSLFAKVSRHLAGCPGGVGLTTALSVLRSGWVIVGSLPTKGGNVSGRAA